MWRRVVNVNATIETGSLVSWAAKHLKLALASRRAASSGNTSLIATFSSFNLIAQLIHFAVDNRDFDIIGSNIFGFIFSSLFAAGYTDTQ